jgi:hypothetical protein
MNSKYLLLALMVLLVPCMVKASAVLTVTVTYTGANSTMAFQNGSIVNYTYANVTCSPGAYATSSPEVKNASVFTPCDVGGGPFSANTAGAIPVWALTPGFAGPAAYGLFAGVSALGLPTYPTSPNGYPIYNGTVIPTQCGIGNSSSACLGKPDYFYSSLYSVLERSIGVTKGVAGLPEGVLSNAARDFIVSPLKNGTYTKSDIIRILVFDPDIFPNATTGKCKAIAPSQLANATGNCLTSVTALAAAVNTTDTAISAINANNLLWKAAGRPLKQAVIPILTPVSANSLNYTITYASNINTPNTDQLSWSFVKAIPVATTTVATTTVPTTTVMPTTTAAPTTTTVPSAIQLPALGNGLVYALAAVIIIIAAGAGYYLGRKKQAKPLGS